MSDLTITNAGVSVTPNSAGGTASKNKRAVIRLTPTITASEHADGDVVFTALEIPNAVQGEGGVSMLKSAFIIDYGAEDTDMDLTFTFTEGSIVIGTADATANISDANMVNLTFIKAANGSTSSYLHCHLTAVDGSTNPTFTASQLEIILHIEY